MTGKIQDYWNRNPVYSDNLSKNKSLWPIKSSNSYIQLRNPLKKNKQNIVTCLQRAYMYVKIINSISKEKLWIIQVARIVEEQLKKVSQAIIFLFLNARAAEKSIVNNVAGTVVPVVLQNQVRQVKSMQSRP